MGLRSGGGTERFEITTEVQHDLVDHENLYESIFCQANSLLVLSVQGMRFESLFQIISKASI